MEITTRITPAGGMAQPQVADSRPVADTARDDPRGMAAMPALPPALPAPLSQAATVSKALVDTAMAGVAPVARVLKPWGVAMLPARQAAEGQGPEGQVPGGQPAERRAAERHATRPDSTGQDGVEQHQEEDRSCGKGQ